MDTRVTSSARWGLLRARLKGIVLFTAVAVLVAIAAMGLAAQAPKKVMPVLMPPECTRRGRPSWAWHTSA